MESVHCITLLHNILETTKSESWRTEISGSQRLGVGGGCGYGRETLMILIMELSCDLTLEVATPI